MIKSDISIFGAALIVILLFLSVAAYALIDRREMLRTMKVFGLLTGQTALVAFGMWIAYRQDSWWILLLWLLLITGLSMAWCLYELRSQWRQQLLPVIASMAAGLLVGFGSMMLCVPSHYYIPVLGVISAFLALSVVQTFQTYQRCLFHTAPDVSNLSALSFSYRCPSSVYASQWCHIIRVADAQHSPCAACCRTASVTNNSTTPVGSRAITLWWYVAGRSFARRIFC